MNEIRQGLPENKMGVMPENKLLINMSLPMMISMLVQAFYNIVDSKFVSQINENALTAVSLAFPAQNLMIAVAVGTGVGINALLSKSLGEKKFDTVNKSAANGLFLTFFSYVAFALLGLFFSRTFFEMQTDIQEIVDYGAQYLSICIIFSLGVFMQITMERLLQSTGKTIYNMITQGLGAIINIILDPILIFGYFGLPKMGVTGAAVATVIGQTIGALVSLYFNLRKNPEIKISFNRFKPDGAIIKRIYTVGVPSIVMGCVGSVMTFGMNAILLVFSSTAAAVFGVYFKLQSFIFMPVFGLNNGMVPILAYNYGARNKKRMMKTFKLASIYATCIMILGILLFWLIPDKLLAIFNASPQMLAIGVPALRQISLSFIFAGFTICILSLCQALGHAVMSLSVSVVRQLVVLLPTAYLLSLSGDVSAVWWSYPIAEVASILLSLFFFKRVYTTVIVPLEYDKFTMKPAR